MRRALIFFIVFTLGLTLTQDSQAKKPEDEFEAAMRRCVDVTQPPLAIPLSNCGTDSLQKGFVMVDEKGQVKVALVGAEPNTDNQVFFRPIDGSPEADTGIIVTTNSSGNSNTTGDVYAISRWVPEISWLNERDSTSL